MADAKICPKCHAEKALVDFSANATRKDGRQSWCRDCENRQHRTYAKTPAGRLYHRNRQLKHNFGITVDQFDALLAKQDGRCANPGCRTDKPGGKGGFHVDHDHETGKVRGLLCQGCNRGIGFLRDDAQIILGAAQYLTAVR